MSKKDEALKLALEALENWWEFDPENWGDTDNKAITAIREALAEQPSQIDPCVDGSCSCCWSHLDGGPAQQEAKPTTREEILSMAREAGVFETRYNPVAYSATPEALERFAALVAAHVRETEFKLREKSA